VSEPKEYLERAFALDRRGREAEAIVFYTKALALGLEGEDRKDALVCLASSYRNVGEPDRARSVLEKARREFGNDPVVEAFFALVLHDLGEGARALRVLGRAFLDSCADERLEPYRETLRRKFRALTRCRSS